MNTSIPFERSRLVLRIVVEGDRLRLVGSPRLDALKRVIAGRKADVLAALAEADVAQVDIVVEGAIAIFDGVRVDPREVDFAPQPGREPCWSCRGGRYFRRRESGCRWVCATCHPWTGLPEVVEWSVVESGP
ncbi:MAG: hypothetical protein IPH13_06005 [Planctomycetes bacterium]|nr:hypothetical protein [Planctomycetota bacterium]